MRFRDPKYAKGFIFPARPLPNAIEPPKVLKQGVDQGNPNYRPVIGFNHNRSQFASVGDAGHRVVNHYTSNQYNSGKASKKFWEFLINFSFKDRTNDYQQRNRQGFGHQSSNRQEHGGNNYQGRYSNAPPPYNNQNQQRGYQSNPRPPYNPGNSTHQGNSSGYGQWRSQRGGHQGYQGNQGYQRYNSQQPERYFAPRPEKQPGGSSQYGGSYSRR